MFKSLLFLICSIIIPFRSYSQTVDSVDWFDFSKQWPIGHKHADEMFYGATEVMWLTSHKGKLFAGTGFWNCADSLQNRGAGIWVKNNPVFPWRQEHEFPSWSGRINTLHSFVFTKDKNGNTLSAPDTVLIATLNALFGSAKPFTVAATRNDNTGAWVLGIVDSSATSHAPDNYIRSMFFHTDKVTGHEYVFAGTAYGEVYRGAYDKTIPHKINWYQEPEFISGNEERVHAGAVANNELFISVGAEESYPGKGGVFKRIDGEDPDWEQIYTWEAPPRNLPPGLRGLTAVPEPSGKKYEVLIGARENPGIIEIVDPIADTAYVEFDFKSFFQDLWGGFGGGATICAYNNFIRTTAPDRKTPVFFAGLYLKHPEGEGSENYNNSWMLARDLSGNYFYNQIKDPAIPIPRGEGLRGTRTIVPSPFPAEKDKVYYFGGFDAHGGPHAATGWIYRGGLKNNIYEKMTEIQYDEIVGVDPVLLSLDIYKPVDEKSLHPVIMYVHGGAWHAGDKSVVSLKAKLFTSLGYVFVSTNYRLSPPCPPCDTLSKDAVRYPVHGRDVAKAVSWVINNCKDFGGDPSRFGLIGHSAGAHLVSIVSTDQELTGQFGIPLDSIDCTCSLDAGALDLPYQMSTATEDYELMLKNAFTTDPNIWELASPFHQVENAENIPDFLLIHQDAASRIEQNIRFKDKLLANNQTVENKAFGLTHGEINVLLGVKDSSDYLSVLKTSSERPSENAYIKAVELTDTVIHFFNRCFTKTNMNGSHAGHSFRNNFLTGIVCYPNPTENELTIFSEVDINQVDIYSYKGEKIYSKLYRNKANTGSRLNSLKIPRHAKKGVFLLKITTVDGFVKVLKIIKL